MEKMKKILFLAVAVLLTLPAAAQYYPDGRPIPPSKRAEYYRQHGQYNNGRTVYGYGNNVYYGFRLGMATARLTPVSVTTRRASNVSMVVYAWVVA